MAEKASSAPSAASALYRRWMQSLPCRKRAAGDGPEVLLCLQSRHLRSIWSYM